MAQPIAAVVTDLIFSTKIASTAMSLGLSVKMVRTLEKLQQWLDENATVENQDRLIFVDLDAEGIDPVEAIRTCRGAAEPPRVIAYVSHVRADLINAARQVGADEVMARSAFATRLPSLLAQTLDAPVQPAESYKRGQP